MPGDPAASEQVTRSMRSSLIMHTMYRVSYAVNGAAGMSAWTPIGETAQVPAGAVYVATELGNDVIAGGPWYAPGGGPRT